VEGGNFNNDWWAWEHNPESGCAEPSGDACNHWALYEHDLDLLKGFGFNAYRFSVEWSRIEPERGEWSHAAIDHYRQVLEACHARGVMPIVT
jgi:beta-glucosidase